MPRWFLVPSPGSAVPFRACAWSLGAQLSYVQLLGDAGVTWFACQQEGFCVPAMAHMHRFAIAALEHSRHAICMCVCIIFVFFNAE